MNNVPVLHRINNPLIADRVPLLFHFFYADQLARFDHRLDSPARIGHIPGQTKPER